MSLSCLESLAATKVFFVDLKTSETNTVTTIPQYSPKEHVWNGLEIPIGSLG